MRQMSEVRAAVHRVKIADACTINTLGLHDADVRAVRCFKDVPSVYKLFHVSKVTTM
jgi:hypothetical protein